jgi:hypothetical protein
LKLDQEPTVPSNDALYKTADDTLLFQEGSAALG